MDTMPNTFIVTAKLGNITAEPVDAIVNSANQWLIRGSGVCGAIHKAAGSELEEYCKALGGCETGQAKITPAFKIPVKHIIHTVGPRYRREDGKESELLHLAYKNSLELADTHKLQSIAFPAISTGVYGYPLEEAAEITAKAFLSFFQTHFYDPTTVHDIRMIFHTEDSYSMYDAVFVDILGQHYNPS